MRPPVCEHLVVTTEHSRGDMLPEPSNAPRPEPIDVISERLRDGKVGNGPQQVIVETAERSKYLHGGKDEAVSLVEKSLIGLAAILYFMAKSVFHLTFSCELATRVTRICMCIARGGSGPL